MMLSNNVMAVLRLRKYVSLFWIPFFLAIFPMCGCNCSQQQQQQQHSSEDYLVLGNTALSEDANARAVDLYKKGIDVAVAAAALNTSDKHKSLVTMVSLETNLATAYSAMEGMDQKAMEHYEKAIQAYSDHQASITAAHSIDDNDNNNNNNNNNSALLEDAKAIVSQTAFFYGMELQEIDAGRAVEMYGRAVLLDPELWAAWANLGSVFQDHMNNFDEALQAYNKAYEVLTEHDHPTDPPAEPRFILSQLQYRMGLCLKQEMDTRRCATTTDPQTSVSCREMATHAFSMAVQYDADNLSAKHMLASITADATMKRASNSYVKTLFDEYATNFEHSLVEELGYDGYARLRRGFDRAFGGSGDGGGEDFVSVVPTFDTVIDAGCGTGLVGEQFRNISSHLIGVDLSEAILDEAEKLRPNLYDERIVGDVTEIIRAKKPVSLIVAADSFIYFGDLDPLFDSIQHGLDDTNGYLAFTLENVSTEDESTLGETNPDWRWQLTASGRFAHRKEYIAAVGEAHDLTVVHYETLDGFRHEHGTDVRGHLFVMTTTNAPLDTKNDEF